MVFIKKRSFLLPLCFFLIAALISPMVLLPLKAAASTAPLWDKTFDKDIDWLLQTEFDVLIIGSNNKLYAVSERRGEQLWSIESGPAITRDDVMLIEGSDLLLVNREVDEKRVYKLEAYEVITGNKLWENSTIGGDGIALLPVLGRWSFLYLIDVEDGDNVRPLVYNINVFNGDIIWKSEFPSSFKGSKSSGFWVFGNKYDVSGFYPPSFIDGEIYFFYDGIRKFDFKTGEQLWHASYTVNKEEDLVRTDADPIVTDKVIYTSGAGIVRAIDRNDGSVIWASEEFSEYAVVPLIYYDEGKIFGQIGGTFIKSNYKDVKNLEPVGVFALDAHTGKTIWEYWGCQETITNIVPTNDKIFVSDKASLIALDENTGKDIYKATLDFGNPILTIPYKEKNSVLVQSGQKVESFEIDSGHKNWVAGFKEQQPGFLDKLPCRILIGAAIIVFTGGLATPILLGSYIAYDVNRTINRNAAEDRLCRQALSEKAFWSGADAFRNTPGFQQAVKIRKERLELLSKQKKVYFYVYGEKENNKDFQGVGGVNIDSGNMDFDIDLDNDKPAYFYDRIYGLLFYVDGKSLYAYKLYSL